ncbi:DsbA family protein [Streptomyces gobiensis]|uniref:DsbA family protein n=1 Tax=Streptomyces gobiensis TaxID=2875706 RepID=UPI001E34BE2B|nr:thioredoxin domain-containing protein [Streptomyces gobiensis]UGY90828.1 DsbA family protein [Streptomyces gobiensis]
MSQGNGEGKRSARERLQDERAREKAAEKRMRTLKVGVVVVAVLAVAGVIGVLATQGTKDEAVAPAAEPIILGEKQAPVTLTIYEDFRCPACGQFEQGFKETIDELRDDGKIKSEYHLVSIIDGNMGGNGSKYAANAAACARDEGKFREYHDVLFANQPPETKDRFADKKYLIRLADKVEGLNTAGFRECVNDGTHDDWVKRSNEAFTRSEYNSTPTVLLDGDSIYGDQRDPLTPEKLRNMVEERAEES